MTDPIDQQRYETAIRVWAQVIIRLQQQQQENEQWPITNTPDETTRSSDGITTAGDLAAK